ncbi:hypothetical protein BDR04DRAFT_1085988 [Suillus decipiens]|nr:hypothetical protein BDR04DRAFT_1085988 [Suillus decipiens]
MWPRILSEVSLSASPLERNLQLGCAAIIIFESSFYLFDQRRHLRLQLKSSRRPLDTALERYMASPHVAAVREAVSTVVHTYQGNSSAWKAVLGIERPESKLIKTILEIALQHRLPRT